MKGKGEGVSEGYGRGAMATSALYERVVVRSAAWVAPRAGDLETGASLYRVCRFGWITQCGAMLRFGLSVFVLGLSVSRISTAVSLMTSHRPKLLTRLAPIF